jgi:hypothetical protein
LAVPRAASSGTIDAKIRRAIPKRVFMVPFLF